MPRLRIDWWLAVPSIMLAMISLVVLRGTAPEVVGYQATFIGISLAVFILASQVNHKTFFLFHPWTFMLSQIALLLPLLFGIISRGATRWVQLGQFSVQPSEIVKPFLVLTFVSLAMSKKKLSFIVLIGALLLPAVLIAVQPDLSTAVVIAVAWLTVIGSKVRLKAIAAIGVVLACLVIPFYKFGLHDYQKDRINTFVNPYADPLGRGYHVIQSMIAAGSGRITGRGLGHGPQSLLRFLPEHTTDFIFASLSESFGLVGSVLVLSLYLVILRRLYDISTSTDSPSASLYCLCVATMIGFQVWVNVAMNLGIAPVTGITLPLLSRGGSSLISVAILLAIASSISQSGKNEVYSV